MRVGWRAAAAAAAGLGAGLLVSLVAAVWLRAATPDAGLLWRAAPPATVGAWIMTGAHGVPLDVEAGAEITDRRLADIGRSIGELFGRGDLLEDPSAGGRAGVRVSSLLVLLVTGIVTGALAARSGAQGWAGVAVCAGVSGLVGAAALGGLASVSAVSLGFDAGIVRAGVEASQPTGVAALLGAVWGALFAGLGAASAPGVVARTAPVLRAAGGAVRPALVTAAALAVPLLVIVAVEDRASGAAVGTGSAAAIPGLVLLGPNVIAAAVVLAHGVPLAVSLGAGSLSRFSTIGYLAGGESLPTTRWLFVIVPLAAGVFAGRRLRARLGGRAVPACALFGLLWGGVLAVLALLLRVEVLSSFTIGSLRAGGGVEINPVWAFVAGAVLATLLSLGGAALPGREPAEVPAAPPSGIRCPACGEVVPAGDRFCGSCGHDTSAAHEEGSTR